MIPEPTTLSDEQFQTFEHYTNEHTDRIDRHVEAILTAVESDCIREQIRSIAFTPNDALPKRTTRPTMKIELIAEQISLSFDPSGEYVDELVQFCLAVNEYYDIVDDIFDGDVTKGAEPEVFTTNELLQPLVVGLLGRLGTDAVAYWSRHAVSMASCFIDELRVDPAAETYLELVDKQADLYGLLTGLSALVAGEGDDPTQRARSIGKSFFKLEQFRLDGEQYETTDPDPWNAWELLSDDRALARMRTWKDDVYGYTTALPPERAELIRPLIAIDLDAWYRIHLL